MRILTILALVAGVLWGGWWFVGSAAVDRGARAGIEQLRADGWTVALSELSVAGFPNRFDTEVTDIDVTTPDGLWGLAAPFVQVFALAYRPNEVIVVPDRQMTLRTPVGPVEIASGDLRASARVGVSTRPDLVNATLVGSDVTARAEALVATLSQGQLAMRQASRTDSYDLAATLRGLAVTGTDIDPRLPGRIDTLDLDATVTLDRPVAEGGRLVAATLRRTEIAWDDIRVDVTGEIAVAPDGQPTGTLNLALDGWRDLLTLATEFGLPRSQAVLLSGGLSGLEQDGRANVPLTLRDGMLWFGTVPLAPLPRL